MSDPVTVRALLPQEAREQIGALSAVLIDCVEGGASVSFMAPLTQDRADAFWRDVLLRRLRAISIPCPCCIWNRGATRNGSIGRAGSRPWA